MAAMYAVYHGPKGLKDIATRAHGLAAVFAAGVQRLGVGTVAEEPFFDTVRVTFPNGQAQALVAAAEQRKVNLRVLESDPNTVSTWVHRREKPFGRPTELKYVWIELLRTLSHLQ